LQNDCDTQDTELSWLSVGLGDDHEPFAYVKRFPLLSTAAQNEDDGHDIEVSCWPWSIVVEVHVGVVLVVAVGLVVGVELVVVGVELVVSPLPPAAFAPSSTH
jgi:hypothetical protein